jgi:copper chaperone CopZ
MKTIQVNTDVLCERCVAQIAQFMDAITSIISWKVDTASEGKVLTATGPDPSLSAIRHALIQAGYRTIGMKKVINPCGTVTEFERSNHF